MKKSKSEPEPPKRDPRAELEEVRRTIQFGKLRLKQKQASRDLIKFTELMMPDPGALNDSEKSRYLPVKHHRIIAAALEEVEKGAYKRLIVSMPPRSGKTELCSNKFPPWFLGKDPFRSVILASYNETLAGDIGRSVRDLMQTQEYECVFPNTRLKAGSAASDRIETEQGGLAVFVGLGGSLTGRGGDVLILDDFTKEAAEAASAVFRKSSWEWFTKVFITRRMTDQSSIIIIGTRWHDDDIVGRLTDPKNDFYNEEEAKKWKILNLPALAEEDDPMDRKVGESLWPERFSVEYYEGIRGLDAKGFSALYQGHPSPEDGEFFKLEHLKTYTPEQLPKQLRYYIASDHAVSTKQTRDRTCLLPIGLDENGVIWVLPDVWWQRKETDHVVEAMLALMRKYHPLAWWAERGHITKSIGPFLRKRMLETQTYCMIDEPVAVADKMTRAQSIQARTAMGMVRFPGFAPWWGNMLEELLKFPSGKHDDSVDALAWIGIGLQKQIPVTPLKPKDSGYPRTGTLAWVKHSSKMEQRARQRAHAHGY